MSEPERKAPTPVVVGRRTAEHLHKLGVDPAYYELDPAEPAPPPQVVTPETMRVRRNRAEKRVFMRKVAAEVRRRKRLAEQAKGGSS